MSEDGRLCGGPNRRQVCVVSVRTLSGALSGALIVGGSPRPDGGIAVG